MSRLQEQMQGVEGKAGGLESQLADPRNQVKEERRQAEEPRRILVVEQEVGTNHCLADYCRFMNDRHSCSCQSRVIKL